MDLSNVNNIQKIMAIAMGIALCLQRLSMAIGSICWGVAIACFLYLLFAAYKMGTLKAKIEAYKPYYKVILLMWLCFLPTVIFVDISFDAVFYGDFVFAKQKISGKNCSCFYYCNKLG